jgi:hypothetical protein
VHSSRPIGVPVSVTGPRLLVHGERESFFGGLQVVSVAGWIRDLDKHDVLVTRTGRLEPAAQFEERRNGRATPVGPLVISGS